VDRRDGESCRIAHCKPDTFRRHRIISEAPSDQLLGAAEDELGVAEGASALQAALEAEERAYREQRRGAPHLPCAGARESELL
jgi:hypothetical protein